MQLIELIGSFFTQVIPIPVPVDLPPTSTEYLNCIWKKPDSHVASALQKAGLSRVYELMLLYASLWQSIERPSRSYDSERALVAGCILSIYDALARICASDSPLVLSECLTEDGGYSLSFGVCDDNRSVEILAETMELTQPFHTKARAAFLDYVSSIKRACSQEIWGLRLPELGFELLQYGSTVFFLRKILEKCGIPLMDYEQGALITELQAEMDWLTQDRNILRQDYPEFYYTRDMVMLYKFLATLTTKEEELLLKRRQDLASIEKLRYELSFESSGINNRIGGFRFRPAVLVWEVNQILEQQEVAFVKVSLGGREIQLVEGSVLRSPSAVAPHLGTEVKMPTEDDVIHAKSLPTFGDTLSREESELLFSFLTVDYLRIPLVMGFFASHERVTYLFNPQLRSLVRSVLFEPMLWCSSSSKQVKQVPLRETERQHREAVLARLRDARLGPEERLLGTATGLLLNELHFSPSATLDPLLTMTKAIDDLKDSPVYSTNASFILFIVDLVIDVDSFILRAIEEEKLPPTKSNNFRENNIDVLEKYHKELGIFLHTKIETILKGWLAHSDKNNDIETSCVVHSYLALIWSGLRSSEICAEAAEALLGSTLYVRNWHGFGMGKNRSDIIWESNDEPEMRIIRFLQSQGLDTSKLSKSSLEKYVKEAHRPLFLHVMNEVIRVPRLLKIKKPGDNDPSAIDPETLPPADVPENRLFALLQNQRRALVAWMESSSESTVNKLMEKIVQRALRQEGSFPVWKKIRVGLYTSEETQLKIDVQLSEITWRNSELRPVPESMTKYQDFEVLFGRNPLHCGIVQHTKNSLWVHIVGTPYDLVEWNEPPSSGDRGVGYPKQVFGQSYSPLDMKSDEKKESNEIIEKKDEKLEEKKEEKLEEKKDEKKGAYICALCAGVGTPNCWQCTVCTLYNCCKNPPVCECGTPKEGSGIPDSSQLSAFVGRQAAAAAAKQNVGRGRQRKEEKMPEVIDKAEYCGVMFNRIWNPYSEDPHPVESEKWAVELLAPVIISEYPPQKPLSYPILFTEQFTGESCKTLRAIGCDSPDKEDCTWKEFIAYKESKLVQVYTLVSHGRQIYRTLIYTSDNRKSLHGLDPKAISERVPSPQLLYAGGDMKKKQAPESSLVIRRFTRKDGVAEQFLPPRLMQGILPSSILEAFHLWQGDDDVIVGEPVDPDSQWFNYTVVVSLHNSGNITKARVRKIPLRKSSPTKLTINEESSHTNSGFSVNRALTKSGAQLLNSSAGMQHVKLADNIRGMVEEQSIQSIMALGFSRVASKLAYQRTFNVEGASAWLTDKRHASDIAAAEATDSEGRGAEEEDFKETSLSLLMSEGYSIPSCKFALFVQGYNYEKAKEWLVNPDNKEQIERLSKEDDVEMQESVEEKSEIVDDDMNGLVTPVNIFDQENAPVLANLMNVEKQSFLGRLVSVLTRIEDISHILLWVEPGAPSLSDNLGNCTILKIELPRIKISFEPQKSVDGSVRLYLLDHAGWFVSDSISRNPPLPGMGSLLRLLDGISHYLLLENQSGELRVLVPNHDIYCPSIAGEPFSTLLIGHRASMGWQQVMDMRYYLYPVHNSKTFLITPTLSSLMYLVLIRFLTRNYIQAHSLVESCTVDTSFTAEEKWVFDQMAKASNDAHPDAHALRLKLFEMILYSSNIAPFELHTECDGYLRKISHVGSYAKLTEEEELDLLPRCKTASTRIKNRLLALKTSCELSQKKKTSNEVNLSPAPQKFAGQPWFRLLSYGTEYFERYGTNLTRYFYDPPDGGQFVDLKCLELVTKNVIVSDEESGSNRGLGFLFLYEVLHHIITLKLAGEDCTISLGTLLVRLFQLKQARWGKEQAGEGETEIRSSLTLAILAHKVVHPEIKWNPVPRDSYVRRQLREGFNIFGKGSQNSPLRFFHDLNISVIKSLLKDDNKDRQITLQMTRDVLSRINNAPLAEVVVIHVDPLGKEILKRPIPNTSCENRNIVIAADDITFGGMPLGVIGLEDFVQFVGIKENEVISVLPFNLDGHPSSNPPASKDLLNRLKEDVDNFAKHSREKKVPHLIHLLPEQIENYVLRPSQESVEKAVALLTKLITKLVDLQMADLKSIEDIVNSVLSLGNAVTYKPSETEKVKFLLRRFAGQEAELNFDTSTAVLLSSTAEIDLHIVNPFVTSVDNILEGVTRVLFTTSRLSHVNRALSQALSLKESLSTLSQSALSMEIEGEAAAISSGAKVSQIQHNAAVLADCITSKRWFVEKSQNGNSLSFDPRFLFFEYRFDILLRKRQVEMVRDFVRGAQSGLSSVQQMIMGDGKTTVCMPLLTLLLADGKSLITQVMPTALVEQTRNILRSCFSSIVKKSIFTLDFDRSVEDGVDAVNQVYFKLNSARIKRGVVCSAPEAIKSLILKFVEQLHATEQLDLANLFINEHSRNNREAIRLREQAIARSDMSDALVRILHLWKDGILIMDEVDVLLHPLRSELNFPIGHKQAIDLSAFRWSLPIHLIDLIFSCENGIDVAEYESTFGSSSERMGENVGEIIREVKNAIEKGVSSHSFQRNPHLVLLDQNYYNHNLKTLFARWSLLWLAGTFVGSVKVSPTTLVAYMTSEEKEPFRKEIESGMLPDSIKLLNLASSWVIHLLPHVLSKIDRVSYGLLSDLELSEVDPRTPQSRMLMSIPFVGKDVPSRSSEFAHPDAVIGLTILGYRYEGLRMSDLKKIMSQLKQDYSRQVGPRDQRPASVIFSKWLFEGEKISGRSNVLPLALFQPTDQKQLSELFRIVKKLPCTIHYYLCQHVFPSCMNFQEIKISACGHELGSSILFGRRIGFSGTPSNLLPVDLGSCLYEHGSDGRIVSVLTSQRVVTSEIKNDWSAKSLLDDICSCKNVFHALIDTGALITGLSNEEVAQYLLQRLPEWMEGVVYLDRSDRQMILLRSGRSVNLAQCGIPPEKRFSFYDQVHTTGMDIKQGPNVRAVVTIGKDMTFRDFAQGCYRMRGIGKGQTIHLYIIPEVQHRVMQELNTQSSGRAEIDIPAWLLTNSMRQESLQYVKISTQELFNVWRKQALSSLISDVEEMAYRNGLDGMARVRRFENEKNGDWLKKCVKLFREDVIYSVDSIVPLQHQYGEKILELVERNKSFIDKSFAERISSIISNIVEVSQHNSASKESDSEYRLGLNTEVVHEQEQQQEQQQEEEAEEEEQKACAYSRDDEQHNPWQVERLSIVPTCKLGGDEAFYMFSDFYIHDQGRKLPFPAFLLLSDNFFRPRWLGLGDRRLKNASIVMEWVPNSSKDVITSQLPFLFKQLSQGCGNPSCNKASGHCGIFSSLSKAEVAGKALQLLLQAASCGAHSYPTLFCSSTVEEMKSSIMDITKSRFIAAISLAEGETLRLMIHTNQDVLKVAAIALYSIDGKVIDSTPNFFHEHGNKKLLSALQCLKFYNGEMYYSDEELQMLESSLSQAGFDERREFFSECLRLRNRGRNLWDNTPIAKMFCSPQEWGALGGKAAFSMIKQALQRSVTKKHTNPYPLLSRFDDDNDGVLTYEQIRKVLEWMRLEFSPGDYYAALKFADKENSGKISVARFVELFEVPSQEALNEAASAQELKKEALRLASQLSAWRCSSCTFLNPSTNTVCEMCSLDCFGRFTCPSDQWSCERCTFNNSKTLFYCTQCGYARSDLKNFRLL
eukprot:TRINITY_DN5841_c0_g1_i1.p1 TRINITY_DN5841_c0_g1~~TRINITY_DN5841_c0_g1_i1.p1  ORF type:complete len:4156 (-),score=944.82 TRINITY_DN5841_c0_g1_i1:134-11092(-)